MTTNQPNAMTDLAAKIESALGESLARIIFGGSDESWEKVRDQPESRVWWEKADKMLAAIAPLVEVHGREAAAGAWDEGWTASERCDMPGDGLCGDCEACNAPNPYRAAQHRSKP